jgi:glutamate-ammonia-ligase adenylyltransferase
LPHLRPSWKAAEQLPGFRERVAEWRTHPRVQALRDEAALACSGWCSAPAQWLGEGRVTEEAAVRARDWLEPLLRRESYLACCWSARSVHEQLLRLLGAARWPMHAT